MGNTASLGPLAKTWHLHSSVTFSDSMRNVSFSGTLAAFNINICKKPVRSYVFPTCRSRPTLNKSKF